MTPGSFERRGFSYSYFLNLTKSLSVPEGLRVGLGLDLPFAAILTQIFRLGKNVVPLFGLFSEHRRRGFGPKFVHEGWKNRGLRRFGRFGCFHNSFCQLAESFVLRLIVKTMSPGAISFGD
jgi:hypothetical protein